MRPPTDMPRTSRPAARRRRRWIIAAVIVLIVVFASLRTFADFYTDALWFSSVGLHSVWTSLFEIKLGLVLTFAAIFAVLLLVSLLIAERLAPEGPCARRGGRVRPPVPRGDRALRPVAPGGGGGDPLPDRRLAGDRPVAELDPLQERVPVPELGPPVPPERRLLRLHPALPAVPRALGVGRAGGHPARDGAQPLPERRYPGPGPAPAGASGGEGAHLGHPRAHRAGQGGRLLPGALRARPLGQRLRPGCRVHGRPRPAARARTADPGLTGRRGVADLQHSAPRLGAPHPRRRPLVPRRADRGDHLPGGRAGAQGEPIAELARASLHPAEHRLHACGDGDRLGAVGSLSGQLDPLGIGAHVEQRHAGQHAAVGPDPDPADVRQAPGHPHLLPVQQPGGRPLHGERRRDSGDRRRPRDQRPGPAVDLLGQHHPPVHPRLRHGDLTRQHLHLDRRAGLRGRRRAADLEQRTSRRHPAVGVLRPQQRGLRGGQHQATRDRLPGDQRRQRRDPLLGQRRRPAVLALQAADVHRPLQRPQPADLQPDHRPVAHHVRPRRPTAGPKGRSLPQPRRGSLSGAGERPDHVDPGRVHDHRQLPVRAERRHLRAPVEQRAEHHLQLRPQLGEGGHGRVHRTHDLLRDGPERPAHPARTRRPSPICSRRPRR